MHKAPWFDEDDVFLNFVTEYAFCTINKTASEMHVASRLCVVVY